MSYSVCVNCKAMVPMYEKYCLDCIQKYKLPQDQDYWRTPHSPADISRSFADDFARRGIGRPPGPSTS